MAIADSIARIRQSLPPQTQLVAVSKYHPKEMIEEAYACGQRIFGESHVQELKDKYDCLPKDIEWHFIGHLQTNKVKYIAPFVSLIHAVDSLRLLKEISRQGEKCGRRIPCLLQLHVACEETKFGFSFEECRQMLAEGQWRDMSGVRISGVMCMATNTDDEVQIETEFSSVRAFFDEVKSTYFADDDAFAIRSYGMSDDYLIAVRQGATLVRVGSKIFGNRLY